jgi:NADPH:quinone reductase-like Zn-dependent oxidoreductase
MKAAVLEQRGPEGFAVKQFADPQRGAGEAIMRVRGSSLNRVDLYMRDNGAGIRHELPLVLGVDGVGEIVDCDADSGLTKGMRVALYASDFCGRCRYCLAGEQPLCMQVKISGEHRHGSFAEYVAMPAKCFVPLPEALTFKEAGALPTAYLTAYRMLFGKRPLSAHETLLVVGAGGGVAVACIQLAALIGAKVLVTSSTEEKLSKAIALGASGGVNYTTDPVSKRILEMTAGEGVDMVIDSSGEASWGESLRSLRRGGRLVTCGATTGGNPPAEIQRLFIRQLEIYGSTGGSMEEFRQLLALAASGRLKPVIDSSYSLDNIANGYESLASGGQFGKIAIEIP